MATQLGVIRPHLRPHLGIKHASSKQECRATALACAGRCSTTTMQRVVCVGHVQREDLLGQRQVQYPEPLRVRQPPHGLRLLSAYVLVVFSYHCYRVYVHLMMPPCTIARSVSSWESVGCASTGDRRRALRGRVLQQGHLQPRDWHVPVYGGLHGFCLPAMYVLRCHIHV